MLYNCLKILHILSATLLLTSIVYSFQLWWSAKRPAIQVAEGIQTQTWSVIIPFAIFQLMTGFTMISLKHYGLSEFWIKGSVIGFVIMMATWFIFIYTLLSEKSAQPFFRQLQFVMLALCSLTLLSMIFLMANRI